jgi:hypothetical protein
LVTLSYDKRLDQASQNKSKYIYRIYQIYQMVLKNFKKYFSSARVNRYLTATGNSNTRAQKLYKANLKIAQAFHPILGVLEVVLRNRINDILTAHFTDPDWIVNQKSGFMVDRSLTYIHKRTGRRIQNDFLKREVEKAEKRIRKNGAVITSGKIIAEQTLGFWTDLFEVHHYRLLIGKPIQIFSILPSGHGRKEITDELDKIRRFRNRISHNEPICFSGNNIDFSLANDALVSIKKVFQWIDPDLLKFIKNIDKADKSIQSASKV